MILGSSVLRRKKPLGFSKSHSQRYHCHAQPKCCLELSTHSLIHSLTIVAEQFLDPRLCAQDWRIQNGQNQTGLLPLQSSHTTELQF